MKLPKQVAPVQRRENFGPVPGNIAMSDCPWYKAVGCAAAIAACVATCALGPEACLPCFASLGASSCMDCL